MRILPCSLSCRGKPSSTTSQTDIRAPEKCSTYLLFLLSTICSRSEQQKHWLSLKLLHIFAEDELNNLRLYYQGINQLAANTLEINTTISYSGAKNRKSSLCGVTLPHQLYSFSPNHMVAHSCHQLLSFQFCFDSVIFNSSFPIMVKITGRSNATDKTTSTKKSHLINCDEHIFTGISCLFNTTQTRCQGDLQIVLRDANIPGQEPSGTDTAHKHTGSKHAKAMCLENIFLSGLMAVTGSLQHHNYNSSQGRVKLSYK